MKAKQDWQFIGRFVGTLVQLNTVIIGVFKKAGVGLEILEWTVGRGKDSLETLLEKLIAEYKRQNLVPIKKPEIDPIIRVNRSIRPSYPDWVEVIMRPELENTGPAEYDITKTEQWLHDGQKNGKWIEGNKIYAHLKDTGDLKNHATLRDLEEIQKKGIVFFRKYFAGKAVFAWGSVVRSRSGRLSVPCLYGGGGRVVLCWYWLGYGWHSFSPVLRHASPATGGTSSSQASVTMN